MTELTYLELNGNCWFSTNIIPTLNTEIEAFITPLERVQTYWDCFIGAQNSDDHAGTYQIRRYSTSEEWDVRVMNIQRSNIPFVSGTTYHVKLNKDYFYVDGVVASNIGATTDTPINYDIYIGATHNNRGAFRPAKARYGRVVIRESGVVVGEFIPVDNNGSYGFYNLVNGAFLTNLGSGTITPGPNAWIPFTPDSFEFGQMGGTETLTLSAPSGDRFDYELAIPLSAQTWISASSTSGRIQEGETLDITLTINRNWDTAQRTADIQVRETEVEQNLGTVTITQEEFYLPDLYHPNKVLFNDNQLLKEYLNNSNVKRIFYNGEEIFRRVTFMPVLEIETDSLNFKKSGGTQNVGITANTTYTASTQQSWITLNTTASGISITAADYSTGTTQRTGMVSVVCNNGDFSVSSSITITQKVASYTEVSYIIMDSISWSPTYCITTPIIMNNDYKVRFKYKASGNGTDRLIGFTWEETDINGQGISDSDDFRIFTHSDSSYDYAGSRNSNIGLLIPNQEYDITLGNYYVYDNMNSSYKYQGTPQNLTTEAYIRVDVGNYIKELIVYDENDNVIFDGKAGYDSENHIGLFDEVRGEMFYNPDLTMTYEE